MKKPKEERAVLDIPGVNNKGLIAAFIFLLLTLSCSPVKRSSKGDNVVKEKVNETLYDLTYMEGLRQQMSGNYGEALDKFEDAIRINPYSDAANYEISKIAAMRRDYDNALKYGRRAHELDSLNTWYMLHVANIYLQTGKLDTAKTWLENVVRYDPDRRSVEYRLANLYLETGDHGKAETIFQRYYDRYPGNPELLGALLECKIRMGKFREAESILEEEIREQPANTSLKGMLADVYRESGKVDKAKEVYNSIDIEGDENKGRLEYSYIEFLLEQKKYSEVAIFAKYVIKDEEREIREKINFVLRLMQDSSYIERRREEITELGNILIENNMENPSIIALNAEILEQTGQRDKEIAFLADYLENRKSEYYLWEKLLLLLNEETDTGRLYEFAGRAAKLFNRAPLPKLLYAFALVEREEYNEAKEELRKVRILVNNGEQYLVQILSMEAEIEYRKGRSQEAYEKFERALEIDPGNALVLNNYAYYLAENSENLNKAEEMIKQCIEMEKNVTYMDTYAWVLYKRKKYRDAEKIMETIFRSIEVNDAEILEHYGYIKKERKNCEEAVILWQAALKEDQTKEYLIGEIENCMERKK
ncbi:MAG: tetratricopeptide repeat protein [Bacteroidales bacterium]|nr:tetratricopeptide repeat protein [Bacteroidales bacterium]